MDVQTVFDIVKAARENGAYGLLVAIIITGVIPLWVPIFAYKQMKAERDEAVMTLARFVKIHEELSRVVEELKENQVPVKEGMARLERCFVDLGHKFDMINERSERRGRG